MAKHFGASKRQQKKLRLKEQPVRYDILSGFSSVRKESIHEILSREVNHAATSPDSNPVSSRFELVSKLMTQRSLYRVKCAELGVRFLPKQVMRPVYTEAGVWTEVTQ